MNETRPADCDSASNAVPSVAADAVLVKSDFDATGAQVACKFQLIFTSNLRHYSDCFSLLFV